jgi:hypothetical protein
MAEFFSFKKAPIKLLLLTPSSVLVGCATASSCDFNNAWTRGILSFSVASLLLFYLNKQLFGGAKSPETANKDQIKYVLAMNATTFALTGLAVVVAATYRWEIALLLSGSCLLGGGFLGLLFGFPQGVAQRDAASKSPGNGSGNKDQKSTDQGQTPLITGQPGVQPTPDPSHAPTPAAPAVQSNVVVKSAPPKDTTDGKQASSDQPVSTNLLAESAATLGKVVAGFSLAKIGVIQDQLWNMSTAIAPIVGNGSQQISTIFAESMILYFIATGFLSGLFLPSYFMKGRFS